MHPQGCAVLMSIQFFFFPHCFYDAKLLLPLLLQFLPSHALELLFHIGTTYLIKLSLRLPMFLFTVNTPQSFKSLIHYVINNLFDSSFTFVVMSWPIVFEIAVLLLGSSVVEFCARVTELEWKKQKVVLEVRS